jgi:phosphoglycolate phosphatase-like HAD superfamily hydrolase
MKRRLVLFDIDGTLVHSGGQAKPAFAEALVEVYGTTGPIDDYDFGGKTDGQIVVELLSAAGVARGRIDAGLERLRASYLERFARRFDPARSRILPGVCELLDELVRRADVQLGLLTGNFEGGARIKLGALGLFDYFPFGSFGDDAIDRRDLPPIALERARRHAGRAFAAAETVIVGDSLLDVDCAAAHGIPCLAVATGWTSRERLAEAAPAWLLDSLEAAGSHAAFAVLAERPEPLERSA